MTSTGDVGETKTTRRRYIKWAGALAAVGVIGVVLGDVASQSRGEGGERTDTSLVNQSTTTTEMVTTTQTTTKTEAEPVTETATNAQTETKTTDSTQTTTVPSTQSETATVDATSSSSSSTSTTTPIAIAAGSFSIFWITDTQFLSESNSALFRELTDWIVSNWSTYNGKFVIHTGDIVQTGDQQVEWENANEAMATLVQNGIPYTWCAGNHDDLLGGNSASGWKGNLWAPAFNPSLAGLQMNLLQHASWVDDYHDGMNTAAAFTANGLNFLVVNIEWNAQPDALEWVGGLLDNPAYADHRVIIAPHAYMNAFGLHPTLSTGIDLAGFVNGLTALMDKHSSNVFLTLNGHYATECGYKTPTPANNRSALMFDRQDCTDNPSNPAGQGIDSATKTTPDVAKVGGSSVTILNFDTVNNRINVSTYDVNTTKWRNDQFEKYSITMFPAPLPSSPGNGSATGSVQSIVTAA